jgi:hypothetical protein
MVVRGESLSRLCTYDDQNQYYMISGDGVDLKLVCRPQAVDLTMAPVMK